MTTAHVSTRKMSLAEVTPLYPSVTKNAMKVILEILFERKVTNQPKLKSAFSHRFIYAAHNGGHITQFLQVNPAPEDEATEDEATEDEATEDEATEDEATEDEATEDEATE